MNYITDLFHNEFVTFKFVRQPKRDISFLSKISKLIIYHEYTDEEMQDLFRKGIKDFREKNQDCYDFELTCPICFETSHDKHFLISFCKCKHFGCLECWKKHCLNQYNRRQYPIRCLNCSEIIPFNILFSENILPRQLENDLSLFVYKLNHDNFYECLNCHSYLIVTRKNIIECPCCHLIICGECFEREHKSKLHLTCQEFQEFKKTKEYIEYIVNEEIIREQKINKSKISTPLFNELYEYVRKRELRLEEERKQKQRELENMEATEKWLRENTKQCPHCLTHIMKNKGCNHMTCRNCKYEFCWYCLGACDGTGSHFKYCPKGGKWFDDGYVNDVPVGIVFNNN